MAEQNQKNSFNLQTTIMILSILTSLIMIAGTFLIVGEFKGTITTQVANIERSVNNLTVDHEQRLRTLEGLRK
jgi:uncharacterized Tic20 family protein